MRGDLGQSFKFQAPVRRIIFERYPATLQLAFLALIVCAAIAILAGLLAAYRRRQTPDRAVGGLSFARRLLDNLQRHSLTVCLKT
jgi:peptide/nickel transport system permease protein